MWVIVDTWSHYLRVHRVKDTSGAGERGLLIGDLAAPLAQIVGPVVHQEAAAREQVGPRVGRLDRVSHLVGQRRLDDLARVVGLLGRPVPEAGP